MRLSKPTNETRRRVECSFQHVMKYVSKSHFGCRTSTHYILNTEEDVLAQKYNLIALSLMTDSMPQPARKCASSFIYRVVIYTKNKHKHTHILSYFVATIYKTGISIMYGEWNWAYIIYVCFGRERNSEKTVVETYVVVVDICSNLFSECLVKKTPANTKHMKATKCEEDLSFSETVPKTPFSNVAQGIM